MSSANLSDCTTPVGDAPIGHFSEDGETPLLIPTTSGRQSRRSKVLYWLRRIVLFLLVNWYKFAILGIIITLIVFIAKDGLGIFTEILAWFQRHSGWGGWGIFIPMYIGVVTLYLPGIVFILGAGFVFGFWRGLLAVWVGGAVGQGLAFLLARYLLHDWVHDFVTHRWRKWEAIDRAIQLEGWKLVLVMRLSPVIPYNLLNIAMATTSMPFWQFFLVSAVGILFECAVFTYFGSIAENITSIVSGDAGSPKAYKWVLFGISVGMIIVTAVVVSMFVRRAIKRAEALSKFGEAGSTNEDDDEEEGLLGSTGHGYRRVIAMSPTSLLEREGFQGSSAAYEEEDYFRKLGNKITGGLLLTQKSMWPARVFSGGDNGTGSVLATPGKVVAAKFSELMEFDKGKSVHSGKLRLSPQASEKESNFDEALQNGATVAPQPRGDIESRRRQLSNSF